ncbi:protein DETOXIFICATION 12 isoform X2 [Elaeis guineensis]|uniref:Protein DETOXIFICATION 12 isoform X2 n=1 Tax=Elaeis guineensis var. tenera TaxID=51953 RepID=A0A6J0PK22_ELAGV|nr:protein DETOXIFICATION 12 isoform X2 [Elaeis guineensis]XP_029120977.1 protein DETOXIFICATION 12 isoform X2 [Elaeis guineensis]
MVSQYSLRVMPVMMLGHLGALTLSPASLAATFSSVIAFSIVLGMASGLETLCGQAYGAQQYQKLGIHTYRAILSLVVVCLPISLIWVSMGKILLFTGQDPLISLEAGKYAAWMIPGLFAYATAQPLIKFLQSQSLILPMLLSSMTTLCLHIPLCWVMVFKSGLGNVGAALSISISYWLNVFMLVLYIRYSASCKATRSPISKECFRGINEFLKLALPSAVMICLEWWSFELLVLLSGLLPNPELETSVLSICLTSISMLYTIPYGLGAAASTRVSNELGAGNPQRARLAVRVVMFIAVTEAILVSGTVFALRPILGYAYSNEEEVINYVKEMVPLVCVSVTTDSLQGVLSGIARGCGWQHIGAYVNLGAFYLIGIPIAVILGFPLHMGGKGLWIGILCGSTTQSVLLSLITGFTNWQQQANMARKRIFDERLPLEDGLI